MDEALTRYLAEEIAEDHAAGALSRREALRRLTRMGFTSVAAAALLAACGGGNGGAGDGGGATATTATTAGPATTAPSGGTPGTGGGGSRPEAVDVTYPGNGVTLQGVFAAAGSPRGAVMVIHENVGISAFIRAVVSRLAADGFSALAPDLLSRAGGTAAVSQTDAPATLQRLSATFPADMRSTLDELGRRVPAAKLGMCGFCFGGAQTWRMLEAGEPRLAAAIPCYGTPSDDPTFAGSPHAAVLAIYASDDQRVNATRERAESALRRDGLVHEVRTFDGVGHGFIRFMDQAGAAGHDQANVAYQAMVDWFRRTLA